MASTNHLTHHSMLEKTFNVGLEESRGPFSFSQSSSFAFIKFCGGAAP